MRMKNKVLIKLIVPELDTAFDVFIPVNEIMWKVKKLIIKSIFDLTGGAIDTKNKYILINKNTGQCYDNNVIIYDTDIRNATEVLFVKMK